jgi:hypothetical protein
MESARCEVSAEKVRSYVTELEQALSVIRVRHQILNMDETGLCSHPMKTKKKVIVYSKACTTNAAFKEEADRNHVSFVTSINLLGQRLKPHYVITDKIAIKDPDLRTISINLAFCETMKTHQNRHSMEFYVREILAPYCEHLRNAMNNPALPVFWIMETIHFTINGNSCSLHAV